MVYDLSPFLFSPHNTMPCQVNQPTCVCFYLLISEHVPPSIGGFFSLVFETFIPFDFHPFYPLGLPYFDSYLYHIFICNLNLPTLSLA